MLSKIFISVYEKALCGVVEWMLLKTNIAANEPYKLLKNAISCNVIIACWILILALKRYKFLSKICGQETVNVDDNLAYN